MLAAMQRAKWTRTLCMIAGLLCCNLLIATITVFSASIIENSNENIFHEVSKRKINGNHTMTQNFRANQTAKLQQVIAKRKLQLINLRLAHKVADESFSRLLNTHLSASETSQLNRLKYSLTTGSNLFSNFNNYVPSASRAKQVWKLAASWAQQRKLLPNSNTGDLASVLNALANSRIIGADLARRGTQLKLLINLDGGQRAYFKPKRYARDKVIEGTPYSGFDRHNGEVVAFHLSRVLGLESVPIAAGRTVDMGREILPFASAALNRTMIMDTNCFYGDCFYCKPSSAVCPDGLDQLEGAAILLLPENYKLTKLRHPWQRTYKDGVPANWEIEDDFCSKFSKKIQLEPRLLDLVDAAVFDFLIGNADRHHYELKSGHQNASIILLDNGKSFGNPFLDETTILAPLYQCCAIRRSTYLRLMILRDNGLSDILKETLKFDKLAPLITDAHYEAINRRLRKVIATIYACIDQKSIRDVIL